LEFAIRDQLPVTSEMKESTAITSNGVEKKEDNSKGKFVSSLLLKITLFV
jgi:hypothetical protein